MNKFSVFGILFMSSILLGSGIYSSQVFAQNIAIVDADVDQKNKCKKDSECKNKNEINNSIIEVITVNAVP